MWKIKSNGDLEDWEHKLYLEPYVPYVGYTKLNKEESSNESDDDDDDENEEEDYDSDDYWWSNMNLRNSNQIKQYSENEI